MRSSITSTPSPSSRGRRESEANAEVAEVFSHRVTEAQRGGARQSMPAPPSCAPGPQSLRISALGEEVGEGQTEPGDDVAGVEHTVLAHELHASVRTVHRGRATARVDGPYQGHPRLQVVDDPLLATGLPPTRHVDLDREFRYTAKQFPGIRVRRHLFRGYVGHVRSAHPFPIATNTEDEAGIPVDLPRQSGPLHVLE